MATNSTRPLLDSLSSSLEAQKSERALRRMTVMYPKYDALANHFAGSVVCAVCTHNARWCTQP
jgi:hypothetical protein